MNDVLGSLTNDFENTNRTKANLASSNTMQVALFELAQQLMSSCFNLEEVLNLLVSHLKYLLVADTVNMALVQDKGISKTGENVASPLPNLTITIEAYLAGKGMGSRAYQTRQIVTTFDYWNDPTIEHDPDIDKEVRRQGIAAAMVIPIFLENELVALFWVGKNQHYSWQAEDYVRAGHVTELAALAIHNARLYRHLEKVNSQLAARTRELETLQDFNRKLRGPVELRATAERGLRLAIEVVGADGGRIWLYDEQNPNILSILLRIGFDHTVLLKPVISVQHGLVGKVFRTRQSLISNNIDRTIKEDPEIVSISSPEAGSGLFVPMYADEKFIGVLVLLANQTDHFSTDQLHFAEVIANQVAIAIRQVGQRQLQKEREQLSAALMLARTAAHDLSQPLTVLQAEIDLAMQLNLPPDYETLERMQSAVTVMAERLREYQRLTRFQVTEPVQGISVLKTKE